MLGASAMRKINALHIRFYAQKAGTCSEHVSVGWLAYPTASQRKKKHRKEKLKIGLVILGRSGPHPTNFIVRLDDEALTTFVRATSPDCPRRADKTLHVHI